MGPIKPTTSHIKTANFCGEPVTYIYPACPMPFPIRTNDEPRPVTSKICRAFPLLKWEMVLILNGFCEQRIEPWRPKPARPDNTQSILIHSRANRSLINATIFGSRHDAESALYYCRHIKWMEVMLFKHEPSATLKKVGHIKSLRWIKIFRCQLKTLLGHINVMRATAPWPNSLTWYPHTPQYFVKMTKGDFATIFPSLLRSR